MREDLKNLKIWSVTMGLFDQESATDEKPKSSNRSEVPALIGGCLLQLIFVFGGITLLVLIIRGVPWIAENVYPWASLICAGFFMIVVPISILLAFFKKTREISSVGFLLSSFALGILLWLSSLILAYVYAGTFWMIVGLLFGGIGVVPIAFIASLIRAEWSSAIQILVAVVVVYGTRALSIYLAEGKEKLSGETDEEFEKDFNDFWEEQQRTNEIVEDFGRFLEVEKPLINDIDSLPYPKNEIHAALLKKEQELCDIANNYVKTGEKEKLPELEKIINALGSCRVFLQSYSEIDPEDREDVDYFNSYEDEDEIPEEERQEFGMLRVKYMTKWMSEERDNDDE